MTMNRKNTRRVATIERRIDYLESRDGGSHDRQEAAALRWMLRVVDAAIECGCHELLIEDAAQSLIHAFNEMPDDPSNPVGRWFQDHATRR